MTTRALVLSCGWALALVGEGCSHDDPGDTQQDGGADGATIPSVTGIAKVATGEYVTAFLKEGRLYSVAGSWPRLGAGDHPPATLFPPAEVAFDKARKIVDAAGGLHVTIATDDQGHVWEWGDAASNPALAMSNVPVQIATDADGKEFTMLDGDGHNVQSMSASVQCSVAVKGDGSVWVWDDTTGGMQGDGTPGSPSVLHPIRVPLPAGVKIKKVVAGDVVVALATDGSVWTWGGNNVIENLGTKATDGMPHRLMETSTGGMLPEIVDIATGASYSYALGKDGELYTWGLYMEIAGLCAGWCPAPLPTPATQLLLGAAVAGGAHIATIAANHNASYAVLSDGTLWAWGSNQQGLVGNGGGPDYAKTATPYSYDWNKDGALVTPAVHIAPEVHNFSTVFTGAALVFYAYAMTTDGRLYSWGRNKTANLGSGISPLNSQQAAAYPNSWDVNVPTEVSPFTAPNKPTSSPLCVSTPTAPSCWCGAGPDAPQNC